jgi:hypothetical protein
MCDRFAVYLTGADGTVRIRVRFSFSRKKPVVTEPKQAARALSKWNSCSGSREKENRRIFLDP